MAVIYHGKRVQGKITVTYRRTDWKLGEKPLRHVKYHSDDFEWGYPGSGPADLAMSILAHHLGETWVNGKYLRKMKITQEAPLCWKLHQDFKRDIIAILDRNEEWELTNKQIHEWLMAQVPTKFYVVDNYSLSTSEYASRQEAEEEITNIGKETGLYIYSIVEAKDQKELDEKLAQFPAAQEDDEEAIAVNPVDVFPVEDDLDSDEYMEDESLP